MIPMSKTIIMTDKFTCPNGFTMQYINPIELKPLIQRQIIKSQLYELKPTIYMDQTLKLRPIPGLNPPPPELKEGDCIIWLQPMYDPDRGEQTIIVYAGDDMHPFHALQKELDKHQYPKRKYDPHAWILSLENPPAREDKGYVPD